MTRNFKQHGRDNERSYPRHYPNRREEEQSPRPARPRPNRASVDRAWENGARQQHHDYHPRGERPPRNDRPRQQGQAYPANRRQSAPNNASSTRSTRSYRQSSFQRREDRQFEDRQPRRYERSRSFDAGQGERASGGRTYHERPRYAGNDDQRAPYRERRPSYRDQGQERDAHSGPDRARRYNARNDEQRGSGDSRRYARDEQQRGYQREDRRPGTERRTGRERNPRFQSRPERFARSHSAGNGDRDDELFEGDYERFDARDRNSRAPRNEERHVTRLPDGRVLRGTRKEQREAAAFWTEVGQETEELVSDIKSGEADQAAEKPARAKRATSHPAGEKDAGATRPMGRHEQAKAAARRSSRAKSESQAKKSPAKSKSGKPAAAGTRPSQRGYKWPKTE
jgi:hypothetical protein